MAVERISIEIKNMNAKQIEKELDAIDKQLASLNNSKPSIELNAEKLRNAKKEIDGINIDMKKLSSQKAIIRADSQNISSIKKEMDNLDSELSELNAKSISIKANTTNTEAVKRQLDAIQKQTYQLASKKASLNIDLQKAQEAQLEVKEINEQLTKLRARKSVLQVSTEQLKGADKDLSRINKEMQSLRNRKATLQVDKKGISDTGTELGKLKSKLQEIGSTKTQVNISSNIEQLGGKLDSIGSKILNPISSKMKDFLSFGAVFKLVDSGINTVKNSVGGAISRFDTLRQFPKVLGELGVSAEESAKSKDKLLAGIDGLPTRLNEISSTAQRMYTSFGSMEKATDTANALNNSLLGSGSDAEKAARGTEQYLKVLQSGKMEMDSFNTLSETMDVGLVKIAESFGFAGKTAKKDLYDALSNGSITIDQFNDKMIELGADTDSVMGKLARETTKGVATSTQNLKTAVVNGLEGLMSKFDEASVKLSGKNIADNIASIKPLISKAFEFVGTGIDKAVDYLEKNKDKILAVFKNFDKGAFMEGFKEGFSGAGGSIKTFVDMARPLLDIAKKLITKFGDGSFEKGLGKLPATLLKIGIASKVAGKGLKIFGKLTNFKLPSLFGGKGKEATSFGDFKGNMFDNLTSFAKKAESLVVVYGVIKLIEEAAQALKDVNDKVPDDYGGLAKKMLAIGGAIAAMGSIVFVAGKMNFTNSLKGLATVALISGEIMLAAEALKQLDDKVTGNLSRIGAKVANVAIGIGAMGGLVAVAGALASANPLAAVAGLAVVAAISGEIMLAAEALNQLNNKVSSDIGDIAKKTAGMAVAIGGIGALAAAVGALMATGVGAIAEGAGLATIALIAAELILVSEALAQVDEKVPDDLKSVQEKIENIVGIIEYMTKANLGKIVDVFDSLFKNLNITIISSTFGKFGTIAEKLDNLPEIDSDKSIDRIDRIKKVIENLSDGAGFVDKIKKMAKSFIDTKEVESIDQYISFLKSIAKSMATINSEKLDVKTSEKKIKELLSAIGILGDKEFSEKLNDIGSSEKFSSVKDIIESLKGMMENINSLSGNIDIAPIRTNIELLKEVIGSLGNKELFKDYGMGKNEGSKPFASMTKTVGYLVEIAGKLNELTFNINFVAAQANIDGMKDIIQSLNTNTLFENYGMGKNEGSKPFASMKKTIGYLLDIANMFNQLTFHIEFSAVKANVEEIKTIIKSLNINEIFANYGMKKNEGSKPFASMKKTFGYLIEMANMLNQLTFDVNFTAAQTNIDNIKGIIQSLNTDEIFANYGMGKKEGSKPFASIVKTFGYLNEIAGKLNELSVNINFSAVEINIGLIRDAITQISDPAFKEGYNKMLKMDQWKAIFDRLDKVLLIAQKLNELGLEVNFAAATANIDGIKGIIKVLGDEAIKESYSKMLKDKEWATILNSLNSLVTLQSSMNSLATNPINIEGVMSEIQKVKDVIIEISKFPTAQGMDSLYELVVAFERLIVTLNGLQGQFNSIGKGYGQQIVSGFKSAKIVTHFKNKIEEVIKALVKKATSFTNIGKSYGDNLVTGFTQAISNMSGKIDTQIMNLNNKGKLFSGLGKSFGTLLSNSFDTQIQNLATSVGKQAQAIQLALDGIKVPELTPKSSGSSISNSGALFASTGGEVPHYYAGGGEIVAMKPKGSDTVPAMLTAGEFVMKRKAVDTYGADFMNKINSLNLSGAFKSLIGNVNLGSSMPASITNIVTTNTTHNDNTKINQTITGNGSGAREGRINAGRLLKRRR